MVIKFISSHLFWAGQLTFLNSDFPLFLGLISAISTRLNLSIALPTRSATEEASSNQSSNMHAYNTFGWFCRQKRHYALCLAYFFLCYLFGRCGWACEFVYSWLNRNYLIRSVTISSRDFPFIMAEMKHLLHRKHKLAKSNRFEEALSMAGLLGGQ